MSLVCYYSRMAFIYVTGAPGAGKSTLQKELQARGLEVHDIDDPDLGGTYNKRSGERVSIPPVEERAVDWFDAHEWRTSVKAITGLKHQAVNRDIIVCGVAPDDENILHLFDKVFYLRLDESALRQRLAERTDNDYGKNEVELASILERKKALDARYVSPGITIVNASQPVELIAGLILGQL